MKKSLLIYILISAVFAAAIIFVVLICVLRTIPSSTSGTASASDAPSTPTSEQDASPGRPSRMIILIDPGHGGFDPGKVSPDGVQEKDINLSIACKLQAILNDYGFSAYLTRESDISLDNSGSGSRKTSDLRNRTDQADSLNADLFISIHQNSYSAEYVHGAQVFYYSTSSEGKALAECIQRHIIDDVDSTNSRSAKGSQDYMVLRDSPCTSVIVECGFLSNHEECQRLCSSEYQLSLARSIADSVDEWSKITPP